MGARVLPLHKTLLGTYFEQGLMCPRLALNLHVAVDYLTFLILLNDWVRGGESPCPVLFYGVGDSVYGFVHST